MTLLKSIAPYEARVTKRHYYPRITLLGKGKQSPLSQLVSPQSDYQVGGDGPESKSIHFHPNFDILLICLPLPPSSFVSLRQGVLAGEDECRMATDIPSKCRDNFSQLVHGMRG